MPEPRPDTAPATCEVGSWAYTDRAKASGLQPSMGSVGDCFDNSMIEAFWSRMQVEVLDRQRWRTRIELANAIFEDLEIWHHRCRRHSALGWLAPAEFENLNNTPKSPDTPGFLCVCQAAGFGSPVVSPSAGPGSDLSEELADGV